MWLRFDPLSACKQLADTFIKPYAGSGYDVKLPAGSTTRTYGKLISLLWNGGYRQCYGLEHSDRSCAGMR